MPRIRIPDGSQNTRIWSHYWTWKTPKNLIGIILIAVLGLLDLPPIIFPLAIHTKLALSQHFSCSLSPSQLMRLCTALQQLEVCVSVPCIQICIILCCSYVWFTMQSGSSAVGYYLNQEKKERIDQLSLLLLLLYAPLSSRILVCVQCVLKDNKISQVQKKP